MMTIGEVLDALKKAKPDVYVRFDFGGVVPATVDSWRGIYSQAALGFEGGDYAAKPVTAAELTQRLEEAIAPGAEFVGWKGGEYRYHRDTPLHIDNRGCCTNTELTRVQVDEWGVMLHTECAEA
jgi:hypothetical protein